MKHYIYKIENKVNGKCYIGKSKDVGVRWAAHIRNAKQNKRHPLYDSMNHHGIDSFEFSIILETETPDIDEVRLIAEYDSMNSGYNLTEGGTGGDTFSNRSVESQDITRQKLSEASKISNANNRELHRKNTKNLWKDKSHRKKVMDGVNKYWSNPINRQKMSERMKSVVANKLDIWSECKKGSKNGRWLGKVVSKCVNGNEVVYESAVSAAHTLGIAAHTIRTHCKNNSTPKIGKYKGWTFRFEK